MSFTGAVALGSLEEVTAQVKTADHSARTRGAGLTPFLLACDIGDAEKAAVLLPFSGDAEQRAAYQQQPALTVAAEKGRVEVIRWLLAQGFDAEEADTYGGTALIAAAAAGQAEAVKVLLEAGADVTGPIRSVRFSPRHQTHH